MLRLGVQVHFPCRCLVDDGITGILVGEAMVKHPALHQCNIQCAEIIGAYLYGAMR